MNLYAWLAERLPRPWPAILITGWYTALILLILLAWRGPMDFRYGQL